MVSFVGGGIDFFFLTCSDKATFLKLPEKPKKQCSPRVKLGWLALLPYGEYSLGCVWERNPPLLSACWKLAQTPRPRAQASGIRPRDLKEEPLKQERAREREREVGSPQQVREAQDLPWGASVTGQWGPSWKKVKSHTQRNRLPNNHADPQIHELGSMQWMCPGAKRKPPGKSAQAGEEPGLWAERV